MILWPVFRTAFSAALGVATALEATALTAVVLIFTAAVLVEVGKMSAGRKS